MTKVLPVIHHLDAATTLREAEIALECGADGVFLISHDGACMSLLELGAAIKGRSPAAFVGINMLSRGALEAHDMACDFHLDALWADNVGVSSRGVANLGHSLAAAMNARNQKQTSSVRPHLQVFGSVAFKYQAHEPNPVLAGVNALDLGMIPTTSGAATGSAPTLEKVAAMSAAVHGKLAVASGMSCDNIEQFAPLLSHVLVSTGVSVDDFHFDRAKLRTLIRLAHQATPAVSTGSGS